MGNVLIAEDSDTTRKELVNIATELGHTVFDADNGEEAFAIFSKEKIDAVLTDVHMPKMDGLGLCQKIFNHTNSQPPPIVVITSEISKELRAQFVAYGAKAWIVKPYKKPLIETLLKKIIG